MTTALNPSVVRDRRFSRIAALPFTRIGASEGAARGSVRAIREVFQHRELLGLLVRRDLKARYKDSTLGFLWSLIRPLTQLAIYYVVVGHFLGAARGIEDFAIYIFAGLTAFGLFSDTVVGGTGSIVGNAGLVKKVYLPREIFPLASLGGALFNFAIQLGILLVATLAIGHFPLSWKLLYAIPAILLLTVWGLAFGIALAAANVTLRDVQYIVEVVMMLLFWASPIVYSWSMVQGVTGNGVLLEVYTDNPVTLAVLGFQKAFWVGGSPHSFPPDLMLRMGIAFVLGLIALFGAQSLFSRLQGDFAQAL